MKADSHWKPIAKKPHHGIAVPLFSLKTHKSCGIGEFLDLIPLIDFCKTISFDVIQLLPINDTGNDSSPYNAVSSCALDPVFLSLSELPDLGSLKDELIPLRQYNMHPQVNIFEIKQKKMAWLYRYFQKKFPETSQDPTYQKFQEKHRHWLLPYIQFKSLKHQSQETHWKYWTHEKPALQEMDFFSFLQFLCFQQMRQVKAYASSRSCFIKGDIPILISPDSADVWNHQDLFFLHLVAGAPPDYYSPLGQKWGFPLFNWDAMRQERFAWWKQRLSVAEEFYHLYRIDHVVGFFRIWAIPENKDAMQGHFVPEDRSLWEHQGREILEMMLDASPMLPIAEDLGTIPKEVPRVLKELGICGTKVIRWERRWEDGREFIPFEEYEPLSLTTLSTPDSDTLQMWWSKAPQEAKMMAALKHWTYNPILNAQERFSLLRDAHHTPSIFHINLLQEYLALFPDLVHPDPETERINVPGTILPTNWSYRMRPFLEELLENQPLIQLLRQIP